MEFWFKSPSMLQKIDSVLKNVTLKFGRLTVVVVVVVVVVVFVVKKDFVLIILCMCLCVCGLCYAAWNVLQLIIFSHFGLIPSAVYFRLFKLGSVFEKN